MEHQPRSAAGRLAWLVAMDAAGQRRPGPGGVWLGYDYGAVMALAAPRGAAASLAVSVYLPAIDAGLLTALAEAAGSND